MGWISARAISPQAHLQAQAEFKKKGRPPRAVGGAAARQRGSDRYLVPG
jgi:hypothetical protein